jgi:hypothetical protein
VYVFLFCLLRHYYLYHHRLVVFHRETNRKKEKKWWNFLPSFIFCFYLFEVEGDGDPFEASTVLQRGTLPSAVGTVDHVGDGMPVLGFFIVAYLKRIKNTSTNYQPTIIYIFFSTPEILFGILKDSHVIRAHSRSRFFIKSNSFEILFEHLEKKNL